jgi:hypothetical protein
MTKRRKDIFINKLIASSTNFWMCCYPSARESVLSFIATLINTYGVNGAGVVLQLGLGNHDKDCAQTWEL